MMSVQEKGAMGFKVRLPSSHTSREMRCAAWSMRRPVIRMSFLHSARARWKGSTLLTKSKSAESISSTSPHFCSNSSRDEQSCGVFHKAFFAYLSSTSLAQTKVLGKRCMVSMATKCMPSRILGKCSLIKATKTLSVASQAVANTTLLPSAGKCFSMSFLNWSTLPCRAGLREENLLRLSAKSTRGNDGDAARERDAVDPRAAQRRTMRTPIILNGAELLKIATPLQRPSAADSVRGNLLRRRRA
mmetsp:Transcript_69627/g.201849  ORF Transcript_69627/g.201849 Transcript_69627/m.201849 type:complete len:245 (-) Transcript_69627:7-741(-)